MGTTTAYYLSRHPKFGPHIDIHIVEACEIAAGASGKAGGFMAKNWHRAPTASLAALSFDLHEQLSIEHDGEKRWGYRKVTTLQLDVNRNGRKSKTIPGVAWVDGATHSEEIGTTSSTAQVTPDQFTKAIAELAQEAGVKITIASVDGLEFDETGIRPTTVIATDDSGQQVKLEATDVVFSAGPWTSSLAKKLLGSKAGAALDIEPSPCSTSVIFRPSIPLTPHALFTELHLQSGITTSPEFYPRPDGTLYICGDHSDPLRQRPFTQKATDATPSEFAIKNHTERLELVGSGLKDAEIVKAQACFRPESRRNRPIIGQLTTGGLEGVWIASGHSVWGICNGPGTGKVMAELLLDGEASSVDIRGLKP
ncbi:hypothetical protein FRC20_010800 [Serendipita sp. 405]|nr:hypothetical protein FRC20_010800 [Serendipita sp. 405]